MIPLFLKIKCFLDKKQNKICLKTFFTFIQIIFYIIIHFIMVKFNKLLLRCYFVLIFCACIFSISYDYGYLSNLIKLKICKEVMSCQMEMYLMHISLNHILIKILKNHFPKNVELKFLLKIDFIFVISYIYKKLFKTKLSIFMDNIVDLLKKIFI